MKRREATDLEAAVKGKGVGYQTSEEIGHACTSYLARPFFKMRREQRF